ncbi:BLUF domain-containing protein [Parvularcula sp. IMCC14364]|uniref:BLUF domain-containing protein n=1 Tax=Parvularcula sp. IMCC14364 TaxID=3067902 RepID=UPI002742497F|nr:BLUF domain-containing protein [Parvularcula sp. IMCC14364]
MRRIIYISTAGEELDISDIKEIVRVAAMFNNENRIGGHLLYNGLNFLQVLEGEKQVLDPLYMRIVHDDRHCAVSTILNEDIEQRCFTNWGLGVSHKYGPAQTDTSLESEIAKYEPEVLADAPGHVRRIFEYFITLKA